MRNTLTLILIIFFSCSFNVAQSQNKSLEAQIVEEIVNLARVENYYGFVELNGTKYYSQYPNLNSKPTHFKALDRDVLLKELQKYTNDYSHEASSRILGEIKDLAWGYKDTEFRRKVLEVYLNARVYHYTDFAGSLNHYNSNVFTDKSKALIKKHIEKSFNEEEVTLLAKNSLKYRYDDSVSILYKQYTAEGISKEIVDQRINSYLDAKFDSYKEEYLKRIYPYQKAGKKMLKSAGKLYMNDLIPVIKEQIPRNKQLNRQWEYLIVLARLNDKETVNEILSYLRTLKLGSPSSVLIYRDLIYTRQRDLYDYMIQVLQDEECYTRSRNPNSDAKIYCGYVVMEQFPGVIKDYPLEHSVGSQIKTDSYPEALKIAREWFKNNPDYVILED